jgi:hypothetical protein
VPEPLRNHLALNATTYDDYDDVVTAVESFLKIKRKKKYGNKKDTDAMEIDNVNKGKGKG